MTFDEIQNSIAFQQHELQTPKSELNWLAFCARVETGLGHDLDGDQDSQGYSLDTCHDFYVDGLSSKETIREFKFSIHAAKFK